MTIFWLGTPQCHQAASVGGKAAALSRLAASRPVPPGFCLPARPAEAALTPEVAAEITAAYTRLNRQCGQDDLPVAVRSSAVDEDGKAASFAGQHETYLNVSGAPAVIAAVERCLTSAASERARVYRQSHSLTTPARIAVLIQRFIPADVSVVVFSADPLTGRRDLILINATWGLGESLVGGSVTPDLYVVEKADLSLAARQINPKTVMTVACPGGTREVTVPRALRDEPALEPGQVQALASLALSLEAQQGFPVDLEGVFQAGRLYLLQCRPITTLGEKPQESYRTAFKKSASKP